MAESAALLGVSKMTLYRMIREKKFPALRIRTRHVVPVCVLEAVSAGQPVAWARVGPQFLEVVVLARMLGVSKETVYRAIRAKELPSLWLRGRVVVPGAAIDQLTDTALKEWLKEVVSSGSSQSSVRAPDSTD